jgi:hypothetical protein
MQSGHTSASRRRVDLGGRWSRFVNGERWDDITVPSSLRPSGSYTLKKKVLLPSPAANERSFFCLEGLTYYGKIAINGSLAGEVGAYAPHEIEITKFVRDGENEIDVTIFDLVPGPNGEGKDDLALGVNPGWEAYGGIIRDIAIEFRPQTFIDNIRLSYELSPDFSQASCKLTVELNSTGDTTGEVVVSLLHGTTDVARATSKTSPGTSSFDVAFAVNNPLLWSPEAPHLYTLSATSRANSVSDTFACRTGFRQLILKDREFVWNRKPLVLHGVCRHDMWLDQGFTLTRAQMREDMLAIKKMGANFVRLVHYPHHRHIVELADELGLLVTEEPGYWQVEFPTMPRSEIEAGLRILEATIRRDWNSPAVFGWFLGNESRLTVDYLREGKALCNRLDPLKRPVSFANSTQMDKAKKQFEDADLDFFSQHLYDFEENKFETTADYYGSSKPLVIDEWGWEDAGHGEIFWDRNFDHLLDAIQEGKIAGHSFWSWNDVRQYARIDWPTQGGVLASGVVTESREPNAELYMRLSRLFQNQREFPESARMGHDNPFDEAPVVMPLRIPVSGQRDPAQAVDMQAVVDSTTGAAAWRSLEAAMASFWPKTRLSRNQWERTGRRLRFWRTPEVELAGLPFRFALHDGFVRPFVVTAETPEAAIPIGKDCAAIYLLGSVTLPSGYPLEGKLGEIAGTVELQYKDGRNESIPLRNGYEVAASNLVHEATRIEPLALSAPQALTFEKDPAREHYQALLVACPAHGYITEVRCRWKSGPPLIVFGITTQKEAQG